MIPVACVNNNMKMTNVSVGTTLVQFINQVGIEQPFPILGAMVNNKVKDLTYPIHKPSIIQFFDIRSRHGISMYIASLTFVLYKAVKDLYPEGELQVIMPISKGRYCEINHLSAPLTADVILKIRSRMAEIIAANLPITKIEMTENVAIESLKREHLEVQAELLKQRKTLYHTIYGLDNLYLYFPFNLVDFTGVLSKFDLVPYEDGMLLQYPLMVNPDEIPVPEKQEKLFSVLKEYKSWVKLLEVPSIKDLNQKVEEDKIKIFIRLSEALHEKRLSQIADAIHSRQTTKIVLLSGPSSSGKTTTCKRLSVQLGVLGYKPIEISMDDFFVEREQTPKDAKGEFDFEDIHALDLELFNRTLQSLLNGAEVEMPTFNFQIGKKEWNGHRLQMSEKSILVIEGIHALNPQLTADIDDKYKFKIFASALTPIAFDALTPLSSTDNRLLRRIIRDHKYRGYSALDTLKRWKSVRDGENKNILPYQSNADEMFNTALLCEFGVMKNAVEPILAEVPSNEPEFADAQRLLKLLSFFKPIPLTGIPSLSILREFLGGSDFVY